MNNPDLKNFDGSPFPFRSIAEAIALLTVPGTAYEMETRQIGGQSIRTWKNAPPTMREIFLAGRSHGERTFIVNEDERIDFETFARASLKLAERMAADGVRKGDRVAIAMRNLPEFPVAFFASLLLGAIATPLNAWWTGRELEFAIKDSDATLLIADAERFERIAEHLPSCANLKQVFVCRDQEDFGDPRVSRLESVLGDVTSWPLLGPGELPDITLLPDDDATLFYTSGTTGKPKGAIGTHRNSVCTSIASGFGAARALLRRGEPLPDPATRAQRSSLVAIPFFHTTGCQAILCAALYGGSKLVIMRRWDVERAMALIEAERITQAGGVPTIAWQIVEHPNRADYDLSSIEGISYGGAPASSELVRRIKSVFPKSAAGTGWGMTETSASFTTISSEDYQLRPDSCGISLPVCDIRIIDDAGQDLPAGQVGEVLARGPNIVRGYWNRPEDTAETFADGWLRTGDLGRLDDEGFLYLVDRKKDMLIRGGENIYCAELETVMYEHPGVLDVGIVARAHPTLGEEPAAIVLLKPGADVSEQVLRSFVASRLAAYKVPVQVVFADRLLPRNANGKLIKAELAKLLAQAA